MKTDLTHAIVELYKITSTTLPEEVKEKINKAKEKADGLEKKALDSVVENIEIAEKKSVPLCQDTGLPVFFVFYPKTVSQKEIEKSILQATEQATEKNILRANAVDSFTQKNLGNGVGEKIPTIYFEEWEKDFIKINLLLKGGGSENIGKTYSLPNPELKAGRDLNGIRKCVLDAAIKAQGLGCPPNIVSVVVGGSKDAVAVEAKKLFFEMHKKNEKKETAEFEEKLLKEINSLGIGAMGLGGKTTALDLKTKFLARHPATFFVEIAFCCWAERKHSLEWKSGEAKYE